MISALVPFLAQLGNTNPITLRDVIVIGIAGLGVAALITPWVQRRRTSTTIEDQPLRVSAAPEYISVQDHEEATRVLAERISKVESGMGEMRRDAKVDREHLTSAMLQLERRHADAAAQRDENTHKRINDLVEVVSRLVGEVGALASEIRKHRS